MFFLSYDTLLRGVASLNNVAVRSVFCSVMVFCAVVQATEVDTVIVADGGPGPYVLGTSFIDTSTIRIFIARPRPRPPPGPAPAAADTGHSGTGDSLFVPGHTFIDATDALLFSEPIDSGVRIHVRFLTQHAGFPKIYSLYVKHFAGIHDTMVMIRDSIQRNRPNQFAEENLSLSGYKSINVSMGTMGTMNLEQALDVSIAGDIAPQTTLSGHLTDQGTSLEGTREVSDFDRIYVELDNPHYTCTVGDQYEFWPVNGGMISGQKKLKGISAGYTTERGGMTGTVKAFGAVAGGSFTIQNIKGKGGQQGPYYLTGNGEKSLIMPVHGTLSLYVNGKKCDESPQGDYTVDYELGTVSFTPRLLIRDDDLIRIEYEYKLYDYQRTLLGGSVIASRPDSTACAARIEAGLWREADDKNNPIDLILTSDDISHMSNIGAGTPPMHSSAIEVDPKDVASQSDVYPLYRRSNGQGAWVFTKFNKDSGLANTGFYTVWFEEKGSGNGSYILDDTSMLRYPTLGKIYRYVGPGAGTATDSTLIPLPQSTVLGEIKATISPARWLSSTIDMAGMDQDDNLFSSSNNNDKRGAATDVSLLIGRKDRDRRSAWLSGSDLYVTPNYTREVMTVYNGGSNWDDTSTDLLSGLRQTWETNAGATIIPGLSTELSYGQYRRDHELHTDRISGAAQMSLLKNQTLGYEGSLFRHVLSDDQTRRDLLSYGLKALGSDFGLNAHDEWRIYPEENQNRGEADAGANVSVGRLGLKEAFLYQLNRKGVGSVFSASDTGRTLSWDQTFEKSLNRAWRVEATSRYLNTDIYDISQQSTMLVSAHSDVTRPDKGISSHQEYSVNIEKASTYQTVGVYAQPGQGNAVWSDSLQKYVPKANGDYFLQQQEVYDSTSSERQRKTRMLLNWSYSPVKKKGSGIIRDLSWYGSLVCEEHLSLNGVQPSASWLPGYISVFSRDGLNDPDLGYSDCSYRQNVEWSPDSLHGFHGKFFVEPAAKKQSTFSETSVEWGGGIDRTFDPWFLSLDGNVLSAWWNNATTSYVLADRWLLVTEKYSINRFLTPYVKETAGWAGEIGQSSTPEDKGWYFRATPGMEWKIFNRGTAEASYTYSWVGLQNIVDPRLAQGFSPGLTHTIDVTAHVNMATHLSIDCTYHGELGRTYYNTKGLQVFSMQMKAYL
jgi:hypothetical protein